MFRKTPLFVLLVLLSLIVAACGGGGATEPGEGEEAEGQPVDENVVTVFGAYTEPGDVEAFEAGFETLEEETGVEVNYQGASDFEVLIATRIEAGDPPDIAGFPQPGLMKRFADEAVDVTTFLELDYLQNQYNQSWLDMATTADGKMIGVWNRAIVKSLVWYSPAAFEEAGYEVPTTWDELLALTDQIVADGGSPWYAPMESGNATGWVGTDWIEDIMLRTTSLENYDRWTTPVDPDNRLLFASDEVRNAWETMGYFLLNEDYVFGGTLTTLETPFFDTGVALIEGDAYMAKQGSYMPGWLAEDYPDLTIGPEGDLNYFYFPAIEEEFGAPVLVGGDVYSMYDDRPEVRQVMEYLTTAESVRPAIEAGVFLSPHEDVDLAWFDEANRGIAEILLEADSVRFDGSDLMPGEVGAGTFWAGVVDYLSGDELGPILEDIDASWPE
ncbi:MAG: ABC transporter substrate-binding protein [Chloroflexaceae bacterium]